MRGDVMVWIGRLVGAVFVLGLGALIAAVVVMVQRAEGVPPLPLLAGVAGAVLLILLSGACLAAISVAVSARRGAEALQQMAGQRMALQQMAGQAASGRAAAPVPAPMPESDVQAEMQGPFSPTALREAVDVPPRPARPGRVLVAER
ncbi:MAG: hypothetical protein ACK41U_07020 [Paracoccus sp. (in: a-proteobacteria)]|uniref:hypothetical protein n=1 Tax=Paracoccus sp. TaxID=267 RepID=UPI00391B9CBA